MLQLSSSLQIFRLYIVRLPDNTLDASAVVSRECYLHWLQVKAAQDGDDQTKKFIRCFLNHVTGVDGRAPFEEQEEAAVLTLLRKRLPWPCLPPRFSHIGTRFRSRGFHEKRRFQQQQQAPTTLRVSLENTAIMQLQHEPSQQNIQALLNDLSPTQRVYLDNLSRNVVLNFASPHFSLDDWAALNGVFRYMILAQTARCSVIRSREQEESIAQELCTRFSKDESTCSVVFDLTAKTYAERAIWQNEYSRQLIGNLISNASAKGTDGSELFSSVLAVGTAFFHPGKSYCIYNQLHFCSDDTVRAFDTNFYVDPSSLLIVIWAKLSRNQNRS